MESGCALCRPCDGRDLGLYPHTIYGADSQVLKDSIQWFNIVGNGYVQLLQNDCDAAGIRLHFKRRGTTA